MFDKGFGCRPLTVVPRAAAAGVRKRYQSRQMYSAPVSPDVRYTSGSDRTADLPRTTLTAWGPAIGGAGRRHARHQRRRCGADGHADRAQRRAAA